MTYLWAWSFNWTNHITLAKSEGFICDSRICNFKILYTKTLFTLMLILWRITRQSYSSKNHLTVIAFITNIRNFKTSNFSFLLHVYSSFPRIQLKHHRDRVMDDKNSPRFFPVILQYH